MGRRGSHGACRLNDMDGGFASRISWKPARQANDFDGRVAIKRKDLSQPASFLILAELYKEAGQDEQALSWAEQGIESFSGRPAPGCVNF